MLTYSPTHDSHSVALSADFLRPDFGTVDPARYNVEHSEEPQEDEDEGSGGGAELARLSGVGHETVLRCLDQGSNEKEGDPLRHEGNEERLSSAHAIDDKGGCRGAWDSEGIHKTTEPR